MFERLQSCRLQVLSALVALVLLGLSNSPLRAEIGAYILIDAQTGAVLDESDATRKWYPASLTKMMTAYVTFKAIRDGKASLNSVVTQSQNSIAEPPSKMGFKVGTQFTLDTALKIMLIKSANDVAVAVAEAIGGSEATFIEMMNREAQRLGMNDTVFVNPNGLPDNRQVSTARDLAILAQALRRDFPQSRNYYKHPGIKFGKKTLKSANREFLLRVRGANGMKTGYICNSGYNVAASVTRDGRTLIAVVLGAASGLERLAFTRQLMDKGFKKRTGTHTVDHLPSRGGNPPADQYCKTNKDPDIDDLMARYDIQANQTSILSFLGTSSEKRSPITGLQPDASKKSADMASVKLANGKVNWAKVLDRTIGPRRIAYAPIEVRLNTPKGAKTHAPFAEMKNIPVPAPHPNRDAMANTSPAAGAMAQKDFTKSAEHSSQEAPGSLFQKQIKSAIPIPGPKPKT